MSERRKDQCQLMGCQGVHTSSTGIILYSPTIQQSPQNVCNMQDGTFNLTRFMECEGSKYSEP